MVKQCYYQNVQYVVVKKSRFIKQQAAKEILSSLGLKKSLSKVPLLGDTLIQLYKMNEIVNKFLLALLSFKAATIYLQRLWTIY